MWSLLQTIWSGIFRNSSQKTKYECFWTLWHLICCWLLQIVTNNRTDFSVSSYLTGFFQSHSSLDCPFVFPKCGDPLGPNMSLVLDNCMERPDFQDLTTTSIFCPFGRYIKLFQRENPWFLRWNSLISPFFVLANWLLSTSRCPPGSECTFGLVTLELNPNLNQKIESCATASRFLYQRSKISPPNYTDHVRERSLIMAWGVGDLAAGIP